MGPAVLDLTSGSAVLADNSLPLVIDNEISPNQRHFDLVLQQDMILIFRNGGGNTMRTPLKVLGVGVLVTATCAVSTSAMAATGSAAARGVPYMNAKTELCLAVGKGEVKAGKKVIQWTCNGVKDQKWIYTSDHRLVNAKTGMCLAVGGGEARKGKAAIQWPCTDGGIEQEWAYDDWRRLVNRATGMCLAIGKGEKRRGKAAIQWPCSSNGDQAWIKG
ncbi:RICIN domain-containing protein [Microtetraspora malaysiensis]|uniref:RICIN domain-containing protein n=2 Tax=Microtetraspora malaysiensis TaxID=161358 RepID=UPI003D8E8B25